MWTRKATMMIVGGVSLILVGMMVSHFHLMILGMLMVSILVMASWISGFPRLVVERELSEENVYKGSRTPRDVERRYWTSTTMFPMK